MKKLFLVVMILFAVNLFAQEKPDTTKQKQALELQAQQLQQELQQKLMPYKAQIYDAQELIKSNEKEMAKILEDYQNKFADLQKKFAALNPPKGK